MTMLREFEELESRDPRRLQRVTQVIAHLLRHQFVHVDDRGSAPMIETLLRSDMENLIASYFEVAGFQLIVRETEGWAGIMPDTEQIGHPRMLMTESLVLLLLRRLWEEAVQEGEVERHGSVLSTLNEAYDAYQDMVARARRPAIAIGDFRAQVEALQRRAIVRLGEYDDELQDIPLTIRALVATVTGEDFLLHLEQLLSRSDLQPLDEAADDEEVASA
jgi:hypothetical protein